MLLYAPTVVNFFSKSLVCKLRLIRQALRIHSEMRPWASGHSDSAHHHHYYWAVQAGLLTPLTFTRHRLSPLATFTSSVYFLQNGRWWQWICEVYSANFKGIFEDPSLEYVWQQTTTAIGCPKHIFSANLRYSGELKNDVNKLFSTLHRLSSVIFATATVASFVLLRHSRLNFHCYTQREPTPTQKSVQKWQLRPFTTSCSKDYEGHSLVQTSFTEPPNRLQSILSSLLLSPLLLLREL